MAIMQRAAKLGYVLPTVVVFSLVVAASLAIALQYITATNSSVRGNVSSIATQEAMSAGIARALECARSVSDGLDGELASIQSAFSSPILANTNCAGDAATGSKYIHEEGGMRTEYTVTKSSVDDTMLKLNITGKSQRLITGTNNPMPGQEYTRTARVDIPIKQTKESSIESDETGTSFTTDIAVGRVHACAAISSRAYCWGNGGSYRLGNGNTVSKLLPQQVGGLTDVVQVSAGDAHTCAVSNDKLYCWGSL